MEEKINERISEMKREFDSYPVPPEALERIQAGIDKAKKEESIMGATPSFTDKRENGNKSTKKVGVRVIKGVGITAAAAVAAIVILANSNVTVAMAMQKIPVIGAITNVVIFRDYQYDSERNSADIEVPKIVIEDKTGAEELPQEVQENLEKSMEEINQEIQTISDKILKEFEENLKNEQGYQDVLVKSEVVSTTQEYFTLKLICYQGAGSGAEWNYYYTIDLNTGERLQLKNLFAEGTDYIVPISENIKLQMQEQMQEDNSKMYWLDDEIEEWNFKQITDETAFYLNEKGNIVISFNEGDVAPMYMGVVTFEIPNEVVKGILKE